VRQAHKLDMLDMFKKFAVNPDELPDVVFAAIGRTVWQDTGATAVSFRLMMKVQHHHVEEIQCLQSQTTRFVFLVALDWSLWPNMDNQSLSLCERSDLQT
jgi:hypothetical protein